MDQLALQPDPDVYGSLLASSGSETTYTSALFRLKADSDSYQSSQWSLSWSKKFETTYEASTLVTSLEQHPNGHVSVAGFTWASDSSGNGQAPLRDGFVAIIEPKSGETLASFRLSSVFNSSSLLFGQCSWNNQNSSDTFVVGVSDANASNGSNDDSSYAAFLMKLSKETLDLVWSTEIRGQREAETPTQVFGLGCAVTDDNEFVYMAGTVKNGATLTVDGNSKATTSFGKDDIFVAQFRAADGSLIFLRQLGTAQDDNLARGESVLTDASGNAILLVNTKGSFFRKKNRISEGITTDVVVCSIDRETGRDTTSGVEEAMERRKGTPQDEAQVETDEVVFPSSKPSLVVSSPTDSPNSNNLTIGLFPPKTLPQNELGEETDEPSDPSLFIAIALLLCIIATSMSMICCIKYKRVEEDSMSKLLHNAEDNGCNGIKAIYIDGSLRKESANINEIGYLSDDERTFASGTTIRPLSRYRNAMYRDTLLRLDPSFGGSEIQQNPVSGQDEYLDEFVNDGGGESCSAYESQNVSQFDVNVIYRERMKTLSDLGSVSTDIHKERERFAEELINRLLE